MSSTPHVDFAATSEAVLVRAAQAGDRTAFCELVRRRQGWLRSLLLRLCGKSEEADDLAQEALLRAWRSLSQLREPLAFSGWLRSLAVRMFVDSRRRAKLDLGEMDELDGNLSDDPTPDCAIGAKLDLERALALLTPPERLCIVLNLGEIGEAARLPLGTVKSHIARGVQKVRRAFGEADD